MTYEELQNLKEGAYVEISFKEDSMKFYPKDISPEFWSFVIRIGTINIVSNAKETEK